MYANHDPSVELRRQLAHVRLPLDRSARDSLRSAVSAYVDQAKRLGWAPEQVLVGVKRTARDVGLRPSTRVVFTTASVGITEKDSLLLDLVDWSIERYYAPDDGCHSDPRVQVDEGL